MLNAARFNPIISILLLSLTVQCLLNAINKNSYLLREISVRDNGLSTYEWSSLYIEPSVHAVVDR
jgi:hypothetical protein